MIRKINLVLLFIVIFFIDGLVLPGVFGFRESVIVSVFLLAMILNWGVTAPVLWTGSAISLFLEFFWKAQPGSLVLMFLAAALTFLLISSIFSVRRMAGAFMLSLGLLAALGYNNFAVAIMTFTGFALCFILFDRIVEVRNGSAKF